MKMSDSGSDLLLGELLERSHWWLSTGLVCVRGALQFCLDRLLLHVWVYDCMYDV